MGGALAVAACGRQQRMAAEMLTHDVCDRDDCFECVILHDLDAVMARKIDEAMDRELVGFKPTGIINNGGHVEVEL